MILRLAAVVILSAAFLLRLGLVVFPQNEAFLQPDSLTYIEPARALLATGEYKACPSCLDSAARLPGYSAFLAVVFAVWGESYRMVVLSQHLLALASTTLLALLIARRSGSQAGLFAFLFLAANIESMGQASVLLRESLSASLIGIALWLSARVTRAWSLPAFVLGLVLAALALCRPEFWPIAPLFLLVARDPGLAWRRGSIPLALILASLSPLVGWTFRGRMIDTPASVPLSVSHLMVRQLRADERKISTAEASAQIRAEFPKGRGLPSPWSIAAERPGAVARAFFHASAPFWLSPAGYGEVMRLLGLDMESPIKQLVGGSWREYGRHWVLERPGVALLALINLAELGLLYFALLSRWTRGKVTWTDVDRLALVVVGLSALAGALIGDARYRGCAIPALVLLAARPHRTTLAPDPSSDPSPR